MFSTDFPFEMLASSLDGRFMDLFFGFGDVDAPVLTFDDLVPGEITGSIFRFLSDSRSFQVAGSFSALMRITATITPDDIQTTVPEPGSLALFVIGLAGLGFQSWRRKGA